VDTILADGAGSFKVTWPDAYMRPATQRAAAMPTSSRKRRTARWGWRFAIPASTSRWRVRHLFSRFVYGDGARQDSRSHQGLGW